MHLRKLTAALVLAAVMVVCAAASASAADDGREQAAALLAQGRAAEAYDAYTSLLAANPGDDNLLYGQAVSAVSAGRPSDALAAFDALVLRHPQDAELRLEAATAHRMAGDAGRAGSLISGIPAGDMLVLAGRYGIAASHGILPSDPYYGARAPAPTSMNWLRGAARFGVLFDSNANQGPGSENLFLGNFPVTLAGGGRKSSSGAYAGLNLDFQRMLNCGNGPWAAVADLNLFIRGNTRNSLKDFDAREWQYGRAAGGARYYGRDFFFDARLKAEVFDYELNNRVFAFGPEFSFVKMVNPKVYFISQAGIEWRDYNHSHDYNGVYGEVGQYVRLFFGSGERRPYLTFGAKYQGGSADVNNFSRNGFDAMVRLNLPLGCRFEVSPHVSYGVDYYRGRATAPELVKRLDERFRAGVDATYKITDTWSLEASYTYTHNRSRSEIHDYDQHIVSFGVAKAF